MTLPRSMNLQWQQEVIEKWLNAPGIPRDARAGLLEMLRVVKEETEKLEAARNHFQEHTKRRAS
jgi:hypothetical protein